MYIIKCALSWDNFIIYLMQKFDNSIKNNTQCRIRISCSSDVLWWALNGQFTICTCWRIYNVCEFPQNVYFAKCLIYDCVRKHQLDCCMPWREWNNKEEKGIPFRSLMQKLFLEVVVMFVQVNRKLRKALVDKITIHYKTNFAVYTGNHYNY